MWDVDLQVHAHRLLYEGFVGQWHSKGLYWDVPKPLTPAFMKWRPWFTVGFDQQTWAHEKRKLTLN